MNNTPDYKPNRGLDKRVNNLIIERLMIKYLFSSNAAFCD